MGLFGRIKKKKERKGVLPSIRPTCSNATEEVDSSATPATGKLAMRPSTASSSSSTIIKYIGQYKHVTEVWYDENGQKREKTKVSKLTPEEMEEHGQHPDAETLSAPPSTSASSSHNLDQKGIPVSPSSMDQYFDSPTAKSLATTSSSHQCTPSANNNKIKTPSGVGDTAAHIDVNVVAEYQENLAQIELTRDLVKKFISEIWNRGEVEMIPNVCHPSLRFNGHVGMDRVSTNDDVSQSSQQQQSPVERNT